MHKNWIYGILALIIIVPIAYYLISPVFRVLEANEPSPLIIDAMDTMDATTKAQFEQEVESMKDKVMVKDESMPSSPKILAEGVFKPRAHDVAGRALIIEANGEKYLRFENFDTINGPDLRIYLSADIGKGEKYISLGKIKATKGNVNYKLPDNIDLEQYDKVLVWCEAFSVLFSFADLS